MIARPAAVTAQRRKFVNRFLQALLIVGAAFVWHSGARANALVDQPYVVGYGDRLATAVFIDGKGSITLLLDTASSRTILYKRASIQAGLQPLPGERVTVYGLTGVLKAPAIRLQELRISDERVDGLTVAALPNPSTEDTAVDGILGLDVLERYCVVLDRTQQRLRLFPRAAGTPMPYSAWPSVPLLPRSVTAFPFDLWYIDAQFSKYNQGVVRTTALFDLGAGVTIINWQTAHRFNLRKWGLAAPTTREVQDGLGERSPVARLSGLWISIGSRDWLDQDVLIADPPVFDLLALNDKPTAIIGPGLLKNVSLAIDFQNRHLYFSPEEKDE
ncbi:MAG: aspartyl protease family protein [Rhizomicrobium sp.]